METSRIETLDSRYFRKRMRRKGWDIKSNETVTDFILREGFPFVITYGDVREDN